MEYLQLFDENKNMLEEKISREDKFNIESGKRFMIVLLFIENDNYEFLIQKTSKNRGSIFAITGGHVSFGDDGLKTVIKEAKEELGIDLTKNDIQFVDSIKKDIGFCDIFYVHKNIGINSFKIQYEEVDYLKWLSKEEIFKLIENNQFRKSNILPFEKVLSYIKKSNR